MAKRTTSARIPVSPERKRFREFMEGEDAWGRFINAFHRQRLMSPGGFLEEHAPERFLVRAFSWPMRELEYWHTLHDKWIETLNDFKNEKENNDVALS